MFLSLPLLSCESSVSVKENPDRKKSNNNNKKKTNRMKRRNADVPSVPSSQYKVTVVSLFTLCQSSEHLQNTRIAINQITRPVY